MTSLSLTSNILAKRAGNALNSHYSHLSASLARLSSGLRINSAADDAAGLAIRELMRTDIAVLNQGIRNVNDSISLVQTADGALGIIDEKLIRMKELAEQASTGTYNSLQRLLIDSEFQAMGAEIDRIARSTEFNGIKLLDGSLSGPHNGAGLQAFGALKIHFGSGNDSAEDYYYITVGDATLRGLGLAADDDADDGTAGAAVVHTAGAGTAPLTTGAWTWDGQLSDYVLVPPTLNDQPDTLTSPPTLPIKHVNTPTDFGNIVSSAEEGDWFRASPHHQPMSSATNFMFYIPRGWSAPRQVDR